LRGKKDRIHDTNCGKKGEKKGKRKLRRSRKGIQRVSSYQFGRRPKRKMSQTGGKETRGLYLAGRIRGKKKKGKLVEAVVFAGNLGKLTPPERRAQGKGDTHYPRQKRKKNGTEGNYAI